jgi:hypothetical protein
MVKFRHIGIVDLKIGRDLFELSDHTFDGDSRMSRMSFC